MTQNRKILSGSVSSNIFTAIITPVIRTRFASLVHHESILLINGAELLYRLFLYRMMEKWTALTSEPARTRRLNFKSQIVHRYCEKGP